MKGLTLALLSVAVPVGAGSRELDAVAESFYYRTAATPLNRDGILGLAPDAGILRGTLHAKQTLGNARGVVSGFVERTYGRREDETRWRARQAYLQYAWGSGLSLRAGKQRIAWGSGFAWNPTNRIEPPKNPLNTGLEQEGALAARMDWTPAAWAGVVLVAARGDTAAGDLPFPIAKTRRRTAAVRARFLVKDTDVALVVSGGKDQRTLVGLDLGRDVLFVTAHAEGAVYRGAELGAGRDDETFFRLATGLLWSRDTTSVALEYFYNGEGFDDAAFDRYLAGLDTAYRRRDLPAYLLAAGLPYSGGLGLRRHYLHASWTRGLEGGRWTLAARGVAGLADGGVALTPGVGYAPRGNLTLQLDGVVLLGPGESEYRLAPIRGAVQARVKVLF